METINKYRSIIVLGLLSVFLLLFAFYMLGVKPVNDDLEMRTSELSLLSQEQALLEGRIHELKQQKEEGTTLSSDQETALAVFPQGDDSEGLILDLKQIGQDSHARLKDVGFTLTDSNDLGAWTQQSETDTAGLKEMKVTAIIEGGYAEIHEWLTQLHALPRQVTIDSFAFQQPYELQSSQRPGSILTANIAFTAYFEGAWSQ